MLKFFRRIRRKLIDEEKLKNYLVYAIGEILLVMIGILLAFQVNSWNENRKEKKKELSALIDLKFEFDKNKVSFLESFNYKKEREKKWKEFLISMKDEKRPISERAKIDRGPSGTWTTNLTNSSLNAILSSRVIDKIENDSLKLLLMQWNDIFEDYKEEETKHMNFSFNQLSNYERENIPIRERGAASEVQFYKELFTKEELYNARTKAYQDLHYQNLLINNHSLLVQQIMEGKNVSRVLDQIIDLLDQEIKLKKK